VLYLISGIAYVRQVAEIVNDSAYDDTAFDSTRPASMS